MSKPRVLSFSLFHQKLSRITWVSQGLMAAIFLGSVSLLLYQQHRADSAQIEAELSAAIDSEEQYFAQDLYLASGRAISDRMDSILREWEVRHAGVQACIVVTSELLPGTVKTLRRCTLQDIDFPSAPGTKENSIQVGGRVVARISHAVIRPAGWRDLFPPGLLLALLTAALSAAVIHRFLVGRLRENILTPLLDAAAKEQRNAAMAETTRMIAHDLKKPFALMKLTLTELSEIDNAEAFQAIRDQVAPEIQRTIYSVDAMLKDIIEIGTEAPLTRGEASPAMLIRNSLYDVFHLYPASNVRVHYDLRHTSRVEVDIEKAARVFSNLLENAIHALKMRGALRVETRQVEEGSGSFVEFCIANNGPVIPAEDLSKIFDAFFTKKKGGSGLGLAISKKIVTAHGGRVWCESSESRGTRFYFTLPVCSGSIDKIDLKALPDHSSEVIGVASEANRSMAQDAS